MPAERDDGIPIRRHTKRQTNPHLVPLSLAGVGIGVMMVAAVIVLLLLAGGKDNPNAPVALGGQPKPQAEGQEWTAKRLAEHLKSRGVVESWEEIPGGIVVPGQTQPSPASLIRTKTGAIGKVIQCPGEIACDQGAKKLSFGHMGDNYYAVVSWGVFVIDATGQGCGDLETALGRALPGAVSYTPGQQPTPLSGR